MKAITSWIRTNPTRAAGIAAVLIGWVGMIVPEGITTGLNTILGIVMGTVVWGSVTPVRPTGRSEPSPNPKPPPGPARPDPVT